MAERKLSPRHLVAFREHLIREEKSTATIEKYLRDTNGFLEYAAGRQVTKELTVAYKTELQKRNYAVRSINSMLASINSLMDLGIFFIRHEAGDAAVSLQFIPKAVICFNELSLNDLREFYDIQTGTCPSAS